jgi:hypothetical protein
MRDRFLAYVACGVLAFTFPISGLAQGGAQRAEGSPAVDSTATTSPTVGASESQQPLSSSSAPETASTELPDSPGAVQAQAQTAQQTETNSAQAPNQSSPQSQSAAQLPPASQDSKPQRPVGTAAAEAPTVSGITAAEPAGVAIAPAKQHRVRAILIRVGAIVGAGVAVGTVIALTEATPSKPPGAR